MTFRLIDPDEKLDFSIDFTSWLDAGVNITGAPVWAISPVGPTLSDESNSSTIATVFVSGGTLGVVYLLSCKITTNASVAQTSERSITLRCETR